jgi:hypothetical protein
MKDINSQNIEAYINDYKTREIRIGEWLVYCNGRMIAAGSKESMEAAARHNKNALLIQAYDLNSK